MFKNLEAEMVRYGVSNQDLADCIGVNERTMRSFRACSSKISWEDAQKIRNKFFPQFRLEYLFHITNEEIAS